MSSNAVRFLNAYASIEAALNRQLSKSSYTPYSALINMAKKSNPIIKNYYYKLKEYGELRNAIVHQRGNNLEIIAEPTDSATEEFEHIAEVLNRDQNILTFASNPVLILEWDESIESAWKKISKKSYSKFPVYNNKTLKGMITLFDIMQWIMDGGSKNAPLHEVMHNLHHDRIVFIAKNKTIHDAIRVFDQSFFKGKNPPLMLVTESGDASEYPIAILSSADLSKMLAALS